MKKWIYGFKAYAMGFAIIILRICIRLIFEKLTFASPDCCFKEKRRSVWE